MNESGQVSIDGPRAGAVAGQVVNLAGGCVCCDTKDDLAWGIGQLITDFRSDLIVLECSGMANPAEVIDAVTDAFVSRMVTLRQTIALVQPTADPEQAYSDPVIAHSLRCADDIILNKRDLFLSTMWDASAKVWTKAYILYSDAVSVATAEAASASKLALQGNGRGRAYFPSA